MFVGVNEQKWTTLSRKIQITGRMNGGQRVVQDVAFVQHSGPSALLVWYSENLLLNLLIVDWTGLSKDKS